MNNPAKLHSSSSRSTVIVVFIVTASSISLIEIGSNQSQIKKSHKTATNKQQSQVNQTSFVLKQQQLPNLLGASFDIDNMTFSIIWLLLMEFNCIM